MRFSQVQKSPKSLKISDTGDPFSISNFGQKFTVRTTAKRSKWVKQITPICLKKFFNVYFHYSNNFEWCKNFCSSGLLFENFDLWVKNFQKWTLEARISKKKLRVAGGWRVAGGEWQWDGPTPSLKIDEQNFFRKFTEFL